VPANQPRSLAVLFVTLSCAALAGAQQLVVTPDHADGVYQVGRPVQWRVRWDGQIPAPAAVDYSVKQDGLTEVAKGTLDLTGGPATVQAEFTDPGTLLLEVKTKPTDAKDATRPTTVKTVNGANGVNGAKEQRALSGAIAAPDKIRPSAPRPDDFDAFWDAKLKELESVPPGPQLEKVDVDKANVQYWKITLDNIRGTHIRGQLARPSDGEKFPALLIVQWAGVYGLDKSWAVDRAADGWLVLNISPHDIPIDQPPAFYKAQFDGPLKDYWAIGNDDRETSYFLRMYLSCYRGAEYLAHRPDWDGRTLVVMGGSQGGMQSLVTAALHPKITAALASVPAGCDMLGPQVGRKGGWPQWYAITDKRDADKVHDASRYFDVVNFAPRIKCPVLIGAGLIDETCPPAGVVAAANQIPGPKELVLLPKGAHQNEHNAHGPYEQRCWTDWLPTLRQGKPAPVKP
jgi:cephalosporin-C deacetylase-like acetyl esterase